MSYSNQLFFLEQSQSITRPKPTTTSKPIIMASNDNPGNFANRPKEEVQNIAKKGGESSHSGGFASMDADKQVWLTHHFYSTHHILDALEVE
jgi:general stress protein YciG